MMDSPDGEGGGQQPLSIESTSEAHIIYRGGRNGVALNSTCTRKTGRQLIRLGIETKMFWRSLYLRATTSKHCRPV